MVNLDDQEPAYLSVQADTEPEAREKMKAELAKFGLSENDSLGNVLHGPFATRPKMLEHQCLA